MRTSGNLFRFFSYYRPHWKIFAADMICASFISVTDLLFPLLTRFAVAELLPNSLYRFFVYLILGVCFLFVLRAAATWFVNYFGHTFGVLVESDMRRDLFRHLEKQSFSFYDNHRTGHLMSRLTNDLFEITELAHHGPEDVVISILTLVGSFVLLLIIRWELALIIFIFLSVMLTLVILLRKKLVGASKRVKEQTAVINSSIESSISGVRVTQAFANERFEEERFDRSCGEFIAAKKQYYRNMSLFQCSTDFTTQILNVVVLCAGGMLIMFGKMGLADLITANLFVAACLQPIRRLTAFVEQFSIGIAGFGRFIELIDTHDEIPEKDNARSLSGVRGRICFCDVGFSYRTSSEVLSHINLNIEPGQKVALVGQSGGGKTTLCHLLPRFYEVQQGSITIDGIDIRDVTVESLRQNIGLVQQDVFMFAGTIRENIAYGLPNANNEAIMEAAKRAEIHDDIMKMPCGYDTVIGERGIKLSGGQKQRIAIARIFLKNPPVLILDEATSALDTATEIRIQHAFDELSKGRTTLVIAHRLSTVRNADKIVVIENGEICECGTHTKLLAEGGVYSGLYQAQFENL